MLDDLLNNLTDNRLAQALVVVVTSLVVARVVDFLVTSTLLRVVRRTRTQIDDAIAALLHRPVINTVVLFGLWVADERLTAGDERRMWVAQALATLGLLIWARFALRMSSLLMRSASQQPEKLRAISETTFPLFDNLGKLLVVALAAYLAIVIWNVDATGWLASAGIVGIAVGFAAQDTLSNLFAGVFILADAPYRIGDYIRLDSGERGEVSRIGLRSTRIMTRDDTEISVPNAVMGGAKITNETGGPSTRARVRVAVGVAYGSDVDRVTEILEGIALEHSDVIAAPAPRVRMRAFGESSLDFELLCWIPEPSVQGRVLHELNVAVYKLFQQEGIEIPFPQRVIHSTPS